MSFAGPRRCKPAETPAAAIGRLSRERPSFPAHQEPPESLADPREAGFDGDQFMHWGMWRYQDKDWSLRPWTQAYGLLIRHAPRGSVQSPVNGTPPKTPALSPYRCAALTRPDGGRNVFLVNRSDKEAVSEIVLPDAPKSDFALYRFDEDSPKRHPDRVDLPLVGKLAAGQKLELPLPPRSFTVLVEGGPKKGL